MELSEFIDSEPANAARTDIEVLAWLREQVDVPIGAFTGDEMFNVATPGEYSALSNAAKNQWLTFCARPDLDPVASTNEALVDVLFGPSSITAGRLRARRTRSRRRWRAVAAPLTHNGARIPHLSVDWVAIARAA